MIYAIVMAGGRGTRLKTPVEKPLFKIHDKPLIKYVLDNLESSKLVEKVIIATSPNTPETSDYIKDFGYEILDTPGVDFLHDLSLILDHFEKKSSSDVLLFINADLPFITGESIDYILETYFEHGKDALSTLIPVEIFNDLNLKYEYEYKGLVPVGVNILRSVNKIQDEYQLVMEKEELAFNINTLQDAGFADKYTFKYNEYK
ncbi:NTP transferase domain-containing protein [Methanobrevibacter sp.]|uniref:NTP transferase domain-containing protein n=1 Tax=Methanobrevibacter sp. TaxID=66852 RepID=UPI003890D087